MIVKIGAVALETDKINYGFMDSCVAISTGILRERNTL